MEIVHECAHQCGRKVAEWEVAELVKWEVEEARRRLIQAGHDRRDNEEVEVQRAIAVLDPYSRATLLDNEQHMVVQILQQNRRGGGK